MVLAALELSRADLNLTAYLASYDQKLKQALARWHLSPQSLQSSLEELRNEAIRDNPRAWLELHRPYPGVIHRLQQLSAEASPWMVLTTKGGAFAHELLKAYGLQPAALYGHEQGSKPEVLLQLSRRQERALWFVEDRRPTLETVRRTAGLEAVRCFLVSWGYLAPGDREHLPSGISLLEPERFAEPLAHWP